MTQTPQSIIDKIARLLRLAEGEGTNPNEAAVAAARAAELMQRYRLERMDVDVGAPLEEPVQIHRDEPIWAGRGHHTGWLTLLGAGVAASQNCRIISSYGKSREPTLVAIGRASDVAVTRYLFAYVSREVERLCRIALYASEIAGRTEANNFRTAATLAVVTRLREANQKAAADFNPRAIVRVEHGLTEVDEWTKRNVPLQKAKRRFGNFSKAAWEAGQAAGKSIALKPGLDEKEKQPELPPSPDAMGMFDLE